MRRRTIIASQAPKYGLGQAMPMIPMQPTTTVAQAKKKKGWPKGKPRISTGNPNP